MKNFEFFKVAVLISLLFNSVVLPAQTTIGGDNNKTPERSSLLELISDGSNALRLPQLTTGERDAMTTSSFRTNPLAVGLEIYNVTTDCVEYWNGTVWISLCKGDEPVPERICPVISTNKTTSVCSGNPFAFTPTGGDVIPAGTLYIWTISSNANITGASASMLTPAESFVQTLTNTSATAQSIIYTVTPFTETCAGTPFTLTVTVYPAPAQPSAIEGNTTVCPGATGLVYSVASVDGVTYTWSVSGTDWEITSANVGSSITVTAGTADGMITVTPSNSSCGNGQARTLPVEVVTAPAQPSAITGSATVCAGTTGLVYYVTNVTGVTYIWNLPTGWSQTGGGTSNSITVTAGAVGGTITVTPRNSCGVDGTPQTLDVTVNPTPVIATGKTKPGCSGSTFTFDASDATGSDIIPAGTVYTWTITTDNTNITGKSANPAPNTPIAFYQPLVNTSSSAQTITYTLTPVAGSCTGSSFTLAITVYPTPVIADGKTKSNCTGSTFTFDSSDAIVPDIIPSNTLYLWTITTDNSNITGKSVNTGSPNNFSQTLVNTSSSAQTITYRLTPVAGSCTGSWFTLTITVNPNPAQPSVIAGSVSVNSGATGLNYSVTGVAGITYNWSVFGTGWSITPPANGSSSITVTAGTVDGTITVIPTYTATGCSGPARTLDVTVVVPPPSGAFAGSNIYWDTQNQKMTFDAHGDKSHELYQGLFFLRGSLIGVSMNTKGAGVGTPPGGSTNLVTWTYAYVPPEYGKPSDNDPWYNSSPNQFNVNYVTSANAMPEVVKNLDRVVFIRGSEGTVPSNAAIATARTGDICAYLGHIGAAPAGYRLPTSDDVNWVTGVNASLPYNSTNPPGSTWTSSSPSFTGVTYNDYGTTSQSHYVTLTRTLPSPAQTVRFPITARFQPETYSGNRLLISNFTDLTMGYYWTSVPYSATGARVLSFTASQMFNNNGFVDHSVLTPIRCVKN